ncbi:MAG TPA: cupredoxin domain-containing protein [Solirubrobacterales bacterium]|nr:cupredoxin domain-containing protein [Solirubrobacterales bacterium]
MTTLRRYRWQGGFALLTMAAVLGLTLLGLATVREANASGAAATASAAQPVKIKNFAFHPGTLRVKKGASVAFTNASPITHTATDPGGFDAGRIKPGKTAVVRFKQKGTFAYHCEIHPFMKGKIVVE